MDFFEQYLHIALDGGSGLAEFGLLTAVLVAAALYYRAVAGLVRRLMSYPIRLV